MKAPPRSLSTLAAGRPVGPRGWRGGGHDRGGRGGELGGAAGSAPRCDAAGEGLHLRERPDLLAGVVSQLRPRPEVQLVDAAELDQADVAVVVTESVDEVLRVLRAVRRGSVPRTVLIAAALDDAAVVTAAEAGVSALVRRSEVTPERLVSVILKARDGARCRPTCSPACSGRWAAAAAGPRATGPAVLGAERPRGRGAGWSPTAWTPARSRGSSRSASGRSRACCTTSPPAWSCATARTPSLSPSARASSSRTLAAARPTPAPPHPSAPTGFGGGRGAPGHRGELSDTWRAGTGGLRH